MTGQNTKSEYCREFVGADQKAKNRLHNPIVGLSVTSYQLSRVF